MDEVIDRELGGLRKAVDTRSSLGDAIRTMQAPPEAVGRLRLKWPVGIGSAAVIAGIVIVVGSMATGRAYAGELRDVETAQKSQKTMHQRTYVFGGAKSPQLIMEFWIDHGKEAFRQFTGGGTLQVARVSDGTQTFQYVAANPTARTKSWARVDADRSKHFSIETAPSILGHASLTNEKIEKKVGVRLNGRACDYYSISNGYCRLWVDPATRLPLQREIYNQGVTLWRRDVYDYPASLPASSFRPISVEGLSYAGS